MNANGETERYVRTIRRAREAAASLRHGRVECGHLLVALLEDEVLTSRVLSPLAVPVEEARAQAMALVAVVQQSAETRIPERIRLSEAAFKVSCRAHDERLALESNSTKAGWQREVRSGAMPDMVGDADAEHLLLALLGDDPASAEIFTRLGASYDEVRGVVAAGMPTADDRHGESPLHALGNPERWAAMVDGVAKTTRANAAIERARAIALASGNRYAEATHLLLSLLDDEAVAATLEGIGVPVSEVERSAHDLLGPGRGAVASASYSGDVAIIVFGADCERQALAPANLRRARNAEIRAGGSPDVNGTVDSSHLLLALATTHEPTGALLARFGASLQAIRQAVASGHDET